MTVRLNIAKKFTDKHIEESNDQVRTRRKKKDPSLITFYVIVIRGKQYGEIRRNQSECIEIIEQDNLQEKLPVIEKFEAKEQYDCDQCGEKAIISEYKIDRLYYKCVNNHTVVRNRY